MLQPSVLYFLVSQSENRNKAKKGDKHIPGVLLNKRNMAIRLVLSAMLFFLRVGHKVYTFTSRYIYNDTVMIHIYVQHNE